MNGRYWAREKKPGGSSGKTAGGKNKSGSVARKKEACEA